VGGGGGLNGRVLFRVDQLAFNVLELGHGAGIGLGQTWVGGPFSMTPDELAAAGRSLYGERWQTSLSIDLQIADRTMRRWLANDTVIPQGVERELREILIKRVKQIGQIVGYELNSSDRSVHHHPTHAAFRYDDFGNVTLAYSGFGRSDQVSRLIEGAKEAVRLKMEHDKETAKRFVRASAWWLTHARKPVRAPGHADRLRVSHHGWAVEFGANSFLAGKAIERGRDFLNQCREAAATGKIVQRSDVESELKKIISGCVANSNGDEYGGHYPIRNDTLEFGAQGIGVDDGADFLIEESGLRWDGDAIETPHPPAPPACGEIAIDELPFNPKFLHKVDQLELSMRTATCFKNESIVYIGDLVQKSEAELLRAPNFGRLSLNEIREVLAQMGLHLGMEVAGWPPENIHELAEAYAARAAAA
jgi:hypothetical protein